MHASHLALLILLLWIAASPIPASSQDSPASPVSGSVVDAETNMPLSNVDVFYNRTTLATITNGQGVFALPAPPFEQAQVVFSAHGYTAHKLQLDDRARTAEALEVRLLPRPAVSDDPDPDNDEWQRNLVRFKSLLLSTTEMAKKCEILNPEVLRMNYDGSANRLNAVADGPLRISNMSTGYDVSIHELTFDGNHQSFELGGYFQFGEATPESSSQEKTWKKNREKVYLGSMRHFLSALVEDDLKKQGFEVYHVARPGEVNTNVPVAEMGIKSMGSNVLGGILTPAGSSSTRWLQFNEVVLVQYTKDRESSDYTRYLDEYAPSGRGRETVAMGKNQISWIHLPFGFALIDDKGHVFPSMDGYPISHFGYWAWERIAEMLPDDFDPGQN